VQRELTLLLLVRHPKLIQIGLVFNPAAQDEAYRRFARQYLSELSTTEPDKSQRARRVIGSYLTTAGELKVEEISGRFICRVVDSELMRSRISELLGQICQVTGAANADSAAGLFMAKYRPQDHAAKPLETSDEIRSPKAVAQMAFIVPLVEAEFNPMGGIEEVQLKQPASFAEEMFLFGGHKIKRESTKSKQ